MPTTSRPKPDYAFQIEGQKREKIILSISGRLVLEHLEHLESEYAAFLTEMRPAELTVDVSQVEYLDSAGALALIQMEDQAKAQNLPFQLVNLTDAARRIMALVDRQALQPSPPVPKPRPWKALEQVGAVSLSVLNDFVQVLTFLGGLLIALAQSFRHPGKIRWGDTLFYMKRAGVDGLPIVGLISLLLGLIIAFMSSLQLKQFGANIYVASLLAIAMVKELGPIMTAILVAGRSGSAFAAEIGTMMVNEEVDALIIMGFDPLKFLALPKVLATMLVVPVLTLYADFFGLIGGMIVGVVGLDLTVFSYISQTQKSLNLFDLLSSLVKSAVFALLIAGIGCQRGFQVRGGAEAVGSATTSAVVAAIFLIIVTDSAFAIVLHYLR
ncbi:MAG: MlaE family lipid ABC transporter permease subunit [Desulfobacca sp.]|nr:MlaE family lipid ABC transporter permease subunit [Desulfobacca sp.]